MKFTEQELERQRQANVEHAHRLAIEHAVEVLRYLVDNPLSSQEEYSGSLESLIEEIESYLP